MCNLANELAKRLQNDMQPQQPEQPRADGTQPGPDGQQQESANGQSGINGQQEYREHTDKLRDKQETLDNLQAQLESFKNQLKKAATSLKRNKSAASKAADGSYEQNRKERLAKRAEHDQRYYQERLTATEQAIADMKQALAELERDVPPAAQEYQRRLKETCGEISKDLDYETLLSARQSIASLDKFEGALQEPEQKPELAQLIKDYLIRKQEQAEADETGEHLDESRYAELYTDPESILQTHTRQDKLTHVGLLLDVSGSMGLYVSENGQKPINAALRGAGMFLEALREAVEGGAAADCSVYLFGENMTTLYTSLAQYTAALADGTAEELFRQAYYKIDRQGTELEDSVNKVIENIRDLGTERVLLCITDCGVDALMLRNLANKRAAGDVSTAYLAINYQDTPELRELVGDNVVTDKTDADSVSDGLARLLTSC
jgi:hypothetical protein